MMDNFYKKFAINIFRKAGVEVNGSKDSDIQVKNEKFYKKVIFGGSLAFGETYMAGFWDCERIDKLVALLLKSKLDNKYKGIFLLGKVFLATFFNQQNLKKAKKNIERHYDIGNDLYSLMLDKRMVYSCGYWQKANNLDEAQEAKLDLICRKLKLKKGMSILDIGCGWGSFAKFVAEKYGCQVTGVTLSAEQARYAQNNCSHLPVKILKDDYRKVKGKFDRVVSIGMFEHVGPKNYKQYFEKVYSLLKEDGISLLHTIGTKKQKQMTEPFIEKYIFPGGVLPAADSIKKASRNFYIQDWHNFGKDYDRTLIAWNKNFNNHWNKLAGRYTEEFKRMWNYYLLSCASAFRVENIFLWQIVLTKKDIDYKKER